MIEPMENEDEKKIKRAAANVNERRRMQSINYGFEALRDIIDVPNKSKLSKSAILRHSVDMLQNVISENQQLREQNMFLRNLFNNYNNLNNNVLCNQPILKGNVQSNGIDNELNKKFDGINHSKKVKTTTKHETNDSSKNNDLPVPISNSPFKLPKKYSDHINKLLASPKRNTRSSVIQQNYLYTSSPHNSLLESPTRRSSRIQEREHLFLTPPSSCETTIDSCNDLKQNTFESPNKKARQMFEQKCHVGLFTPQSAKGFPVRSAKRSLDAIIQAIDELEKS